MKTYRLCGQTVDTLHRGPCRRCGKRYGSFFRSTSMSDTNFISRPTMSMKNDQRGWFLISSLPRKNIRNNLEHWANMTGVSWDQRTRSIISLYLIQKGFVTFSRSQALSTILIIVSPPTCIQYIYPIVKGTNLCVRVPEGSTIECCHISFE
jgi:hypothetical protein